MHTHTLYIYSEKKQLPKKQKKQKHMIIINLVILKTMIVKKILQAVRKYVK